MARYKYISADNHIDQVWMPRNLWQDRLPSRLKDAGPKVIETPEGSMWEWEGKLRMESADGSLNGRHRQRIFAAKGLETPEGSLPPSDPTLLLAHLDLSGIYAAIFYTDPPMWEVEDPELRQEIHRCYNDFLLDLNRHAPDRLVGLPALATRHPEVCVAEMLRVAKQGAKGVEFNVYDADPPLWHRSWDRLWSTAEELGIPICCHIGFKEGTAFPPNEDGRLLSFYSVAPFGAAAPISQFILSGILERHAKLHVAFAECRIGWIPFLISWLDRQVHRRRPDQTVKLGRLPSEYFARQMTVTFEDDLVGARMLPMEWACLKDSAMWGADYSHTQGVWPNVEQILDEVFQGIDPDLKEEIVYRRAARIFKLKAPPPARSAGAGR